MLAGSLHPPFSLFLPEEKERMRRARWKREKEVYAPAGGQGTGDAQDVPPFLRMSFARGVVLAGVGLSSNGPAPLSVAAALARRRSFQKMAAGEAPPLIWQALKKKFGKRGTDGTAGVRQQKEELIHAVKNKPRSI